MAYRAALGVNVMALGWVNPKPTLEIRSVTLVRAGGHANPALLGLTVLDPGTP